MAKSEDKEAQFIPSCDPKFQPVFAETCRAIAMKGTTKYALCLVSEPNKCCYLFKYNFIGICNHPRCQDIVTRTIQMGEKKMH
jgi:hypothetical protein